MTYTISHKIMGDSILLLVLFLPEYIDLILVNGLDWGESSVRSDLYQTCKLLNLLASRDRCIIDGAKS